MCSRDELSSTLSPCRRILPSLSLLVRVWPSWALLLLQTRVPYCRLVSTVRRRQYQFRHFLVTTLSSLSMWIRLSPGLLRRFFLCLPQAAVPEAFFFLELRAMPPRTKLSMKALPPRGPVLVFAARQPRRRRHRFHAALAYVESEPTVAIARRHVAQTPTETAGAAKETPMHFVSSSRRRPLARKISARSDLP